MWYKNNGINTFIKVFAKIITIINLIAITYFFKIIYRNIFKYLLAIDSKNLRLFGPIFTYFDIVKTIN